MNGVNQLWAKTCHHVGSAYQTKYSCSSVGVARKSQLYVQATVRVPRLPLSEPSATKNPTTIAVTRATIVSSSAVSAPLQYGPEESADQKRCESKLASNYFTSPTGILYFFASFASVPFDFNVFRPAAIFAPSASPLR
jgi:hypothetical protein